MSVFKNENIYLGSLPRPRKEKKLPIVLSREDVIRIFESVNNIKHKAILMLAYSSGLRVSEVVYTHVSQRDIGRIKSPLDFGRG